ncbi:MAG: TlpA family protein disulfide reductase [Gemmataceae bacterium]|nr:TlpA family protein disulfide reductase [Gemmataceae bacterium]
MRPLLAAVVVASVGLYFVFGQPKPAAKPDPAAADKLKELRKKFLAEFEPLDERFRNAATAAEARGVQAEAKETASLAAGRFRKLAEAHATDPVALDVAAFVLSTLAPLGAEGPDVDAVVGVVAEHHLGDPRARDLVELAAAVGPAGEKLVAAAAEKAPDKGVKAVGLFHLGTRTGERGDAEADEAKAAAQYAKAVEYLEQAAKTAPEVPVGESTLGKAAEDAIAVFKTLVVGKPAPEVVGTTVDGKTVKLSDYKGKVVLLDFWFTGCPPCRAMIPHERELVSKLKGRPFELVSVSTDAEKEDLTSFLGRFPMPWTHWYDGPDGKVAQTYRVKASPTLYLIDAKGVIRKRWVGVPGGDPKSTIIDEAVEKLLKEVG